MKTRTRRPRGLRPSAGLLTRLFRTVLRGLAKYKVFTVTVVNREAVPPKGRAIVASNHISVADPVFLWGAVRRSAVALAMAELWRMPVINLLMISLGHIPVKRGDHESGARALSAGKAVLEHDGLLFLYPEGKCARDEQLLPFKSGVAELAFATGAPVIPAGISGSNRVMPLDSRRLRRRQPVHLNFGEPLEPANFTGPAAKLEFMAELRCRIEALRT